MPLRYDSFLGRGGGNIFPPERIAVTRVALNTSTGPQDITINGFGTPKAALFILSAAVNNATVEGDCALSIGATDGTNQWVHATRADDNVALTNTTRRGTSDEVIMLLTTSGAILLEANFDSWITDGVRINLTNADTAKLLTVVLFGGPGLKAEANTVNGATSGNISTANPGFEMNALIMARQALVNDSISSEALLGMGFASWDGATLRQVSYEFRSLDAQANTEVRAAIDNAAIMNNHNPSQDVTIENITDTSFDLRSNGTDWDTSDFGYLALNFGNGAAWAGVLDGPTVTGDQAWTGIGFQPSFALLIPTMMSAVNVARQDNAEAGASAVSAFSADAEYATGRSDENAADPTNAHSWSNDQAVDLNDHAGNDAFDATFKSFDADGLTLNFTAVDSGGSPETPRKWPALFIKVVQ